MTLDMAAVSFIDAAGIEMLTAANVGAKSRRILFTLEAIPEHALLVLEGSAASQQLSMRSRAPVNGSSSSANGRSPNGLDRRP